MASSDLNELYALMKKGDKESENRLFKILSVRFLMSAQRRIRNYQDAQEVVQNSLLVISQKIGEIKIERSFAAWAYKTLKNCTLDYFSKSSTRCKFETGETELIMSNIENDNNLTRRQLLKCLKMICQKQAKYARILNLHYQGYSTEEIGIRMNITSANIYTILSRARSLLIHCLDKGNI
jgi:RNA polymerase sigma factor (sigma-70 family)